MYEKFRAIVLSTVRHSDKTNIVSLYTDTRGHLSVAVQAPAQTRGGRLRAAALMPLSVIEGEVNFNGVSILLPMRRFSSLRANTRIIGNPFKSAIAMFVSEFLMRLLRESPADETLWNFLAVSIATLDATTEPANFLPTFLSLLTRYTGIRPDTADYHDGAVFDMREGRFAEFHPLHNDTVSGDEARVLLLLSRLSYRNYTLIRMSVESRRRILNGLLHYYAVHFPGLERLRSPEILSGLFS